jgi:hypothetical protein
MAIQYGQLSMYLRAASQVVTTLAQAMNESTCGQAWFV